MKREKITPEQIGSKLGDPDFLDEEGSLIPTSRCGRSKEIGGIKLLFDYDIKRGYISVSFRKSRDVIGAIDYRLPRAGIEGGVSFLHRPSKGSLVCRVTREQFIDNMLRDYPEVGVWILWNV
jgi:hypothetical protein